MFFDEFLRIRLIFSPISTFSSGKRPTDHRSSSEPDEKPRPPAGEEPDKGGISMKNYNKQNLIISIESSIDFIESHLDSADKTIAFVFKKHSVRNLEKSSIHTLQDLFSELFAIEADLR